ncbi:hypothetical protein [Haloparvum sp. PAK95]|uniref:hypothetical protein n=1 Tax=Haloparvum sp. PAK95 TaxID=3418962 RepID=UPI003D2EA8D4
MTQPDESDAWLDGAAASEGDREELLRRAIVSLAEEADVDAPEADTVAALQTRVDDLEGTVNGLEGTVADVEDELATLAADLEEITTSLPEDVPEGDRPAEAMTDLRGEVEALDDEVTELREEFDEKVSDVRERVVQVLRKAESKAAEDHSHPALASRLDELDTSLQSVGDRVEELEGDLETRTESLETTVESQADRVDDVEGKLTRVASAVVALQRRVGELETAQAKRDSVEQLTAVANRHGITDADCENCDRTVHLGLLSAPRCPHCESHFESVEPKSGFFGNARITVGERPALGGEHNPPTEPEDVLEE